MVKVYRKVTIAKTEFADYSVHLIEKRRVNEDNVNQVFATGYMISLCYRICDISSSKRRKSIEMMFDKMKSGRSIPKDRNKYKTLFEKEINLVKLFEDGYTIKEPEKLFNKLISLMLK